MEKNHKDSADFWCWNMNLKTQNSQFLTALEILFVKDMMSFMSGQNYTLVECPA